MNFNTIVSDFMKFVNKVDLRKMDDNNWRDFIICLSPIAPHTSEYLWSMIGNKRSVFANSWPRINIKKNKTVNLIVQINGKKKVIISVASDLKKEEITEKALNKISKNSVVGKNNIKKVIYIEGKIINFVIRESEKIWQNQKKD